LSEFVPSRFRCIKGYDSIKGKQLKKQKVKEKEGKKLKNLKLDFEDSADSDVGVPGVLNWTYPFALARRLKVAAFEGDDGEGDSVDEATRLSLARPRFFEVIAQSKVYGSDPFESIWRHGILECPTMELALTLVGDVTKPPPTKKVRYCPWQHCAWQNLAEGDRWIMSCQYESLWPFGVSTDAHTHGGDGKDPVVLYPDLFGDDFGLSSTQPLGEDCRKDERWKLADMKCSVAASLPLLRSMGAFVTCHLHKGVTHILCDLDGMDSVLWQRERGSLDSFKEKHHESKLLDRLEATIADHSVLLVSSAWVDKEWKG
jgi:hypothetical protein